MRRLIFLAFLILTFVNNSFSSEIRIMGGSTSIKTTLEPIKPYFEKETGIKLTLIPVGSKKALIELDNGNCDAVSTAHSYQELLEEIKKENITLKNLNNFKTFVIHKETNYSVIVNDNNPINKLTKAQLKSIFTGKIKNWKEVGGNDLEIQVIWGTLTEGTKLEVKKKILDKEEPIESAINVATDSSIIKVVSENPKAISVVASASIDPIKVKKVNTPEIKSNPIILITLGEPNKLTKMLLDFIKKESGKLR